MDLGKFLFGFFGFGLGLISFYLLKNILPKYFETKAVHQAMKEDIGEITDIVESIKAELLQKTEELKAQVSLINQHKIQIKTAEREAFFDYNRKLSARLFHLLGFIIIGYKFSDYEKMDEKVFEEITQRQLELDIAEAHLFIFYRDKDFVEYKAKLHKGILEYETIIKDLIFEVKKLYLESYFEIKRDPNKHLEVSRNAMELEVRINEKYSELRVKKYKEIHLLHFRMMNLIYDRLTKIEEEIAKDGDMKIIN